MRPTACNPGTSPSLPPKQSSAEGCCLPGGFSDARGARLRPVESSAVGALRFRPPPTAPRALFGRESSAGTGQRLGYPPPRTLGCFPRAKDAAAKAPERHGREGAPGRALPGSRLPPATLRRAPRGSRPDQTACCCVPTEQKAEEGKARRGLLSLSSEEPFRRGEVSRGGRIQKFAVAWLRSLARASQAPAKSPQSLKPTGGEGLVTQGGSVPPPWPESRFEHGSPPSGSLCKRRSRERGPRPLSGPSSFQAPLPEGAHADRPQPGICKRRKHFFFGGRAGGGGCLRLSSSL